MIDSQKVLYSEGKSNEFFTPAYAVEPILPFIPEGKVIWSPFDTENSEFVKLISKTNKVIFSHLDFGQDFYNYEPEDYWDMIISNPPFERKKDIFLRALSFGKPIALLMNIVWLNDTASKNVFIESNRNMELLLLDKRTIFTNSEGVADKKITFNSSYFCSDFLPKDIITYQIPKDKYKKYVIS